GDRGLDRGEVSPQAPPAHFGQADTGRIRDHNGPRRLSGGITTRVNQTLSRPWLVAEGSQLPFIGMPATIPSRPGPQVVDSMNDFLAQIPWQVRQAQWNMLGSHDTARIRTVVGSDERLIVAAAALLTLPGTPVIFAGDELGA